MWKIIQRPETALVESQAPVQKISMFRLWAIFQAKGKFGETPNEPFEN